MIKLLYTAAFLIFCLGTVESGYAQCNKIIWEDNFDGTTLDASNWTATSGNGCGGPSGCGFGNNELQYYRDGTNNIVVNGGNLVITAKNESFGGSNYTSGKITTSGKRAFRYGRVEARMKLPSASAIWPAFWMLPENGSWPYAGEIDIMETQNTTTTKVDQTLHFFCTPCGNHQYIGNAYTNGTTNYAADFHTYAVDWSPGRIEYSIDGVITKVYTPESTYTKGNIRSDWPFDEGNWYIILNLAVGGAYTGNATPNPADYPQSLLVDYVRLYSTPASTNPAFTSTLGIKGTDVLFTDVESTYSASTLGNGIKATGITYNWTIDGGSIVSGQGTDVVVAKWTSAGAKSISLSADLDGVGSCAAVSVTYPVSVFTRLCNVILDDYEANRNMSLMSSSYGVYTSPFANPDKSGVNTSNFCARYVRNAGQQYDRLRTDKFMAGLPADFRTGIVKFKMDVRTDAPAGTPITIELANRRNPDYPQGIHSQYTAVTGPPNVWTTITFTWLASPNAALTDIDVNRIQILFNSNSYTNHTYYIDNFSAQGSAPSTSTINGNASNTCNATDVTYSVTATTGSAYAWTVPSGATISSGQGTNTIKVAVGNTNGTVAVTETNRLKCTGTIQSKGVTVTGCVTTGIEEDQIRQQQVEVYPNPFNGNVSIRTHTENGSAVTVHIFDSKGGLIYFSEDVPSDDIVEVGKQFPDGIYLVKVFNKDLLYTTKIIKKQ